MIIKVSEKVKKTLVTKPQDICNLFNDVLKTECSVDRDKEHFWIVGLNARNQIKYIELCSLGILNASIVHPREVFRTAVMTAASNIILVHNHPSGDPTPSDDDCKLTKRLIEAGTLMGIEVLDHVIVCENDHYSFSSSKNSLFVFNSEGR